MLVKTKSWSRLREPMRAETALAARAVRRNPDCRDVSQSVRSQTRIRHFLADHHVTIAFVLRQGCVVTAAVRPRRLYVKRGSSAFPRGPAGRAPAGRSAIR